MFSPHFSLYYNLCNASLVFHGMMISWYYALDSLTWDYNWQKLKLHKSESYSNPFSKKEFQDGHFRTLPTGSSPVVSTSKMAPDPLLSFLYNAPADDKSESMQPDSSSEVSLEDENSEETILDRYNWLPLFIISYLHVFFWMVSLIK